MYASLTRFPGDLFSELEALQRQVEQRLGVHGPASSIRAAGRGAFPAINMGTSPEAIEIYAFAPGIDPAKLEVSVDKGLLTIAGERRTALPDEDEKVSVYARERFDGPFKRAIGLPYDADASSVEATYMNGVLKIVVPKVQSHKPRRVEVRT